MRERGSRFNWRSNVCPMLFGSRVFHQVLYIFAHVLYYARACLELLCLECVPSCRVLHAGALHVPTAEALLGPVVVAMANTVGRTELLTWLKSFLAQIPAGEVRPITRAGRLLRSSINRAASAWPRCTLCLKPINRRCADSGHLIVHALLLKAPGLL